MPVFESLLPPPHDAMVQDLLFVLASWHGVAKLRMHTESTLSILEDLTTTFSLLLRHFAAWTCEAYTTVELPREAAAQAQRKAKKSVTQGSTVDPPNPTSRPMGNPRNQKKLNLTTYKLHAMGDYVATIRRFGTVEPYSMQAVCFILSATFDLSDICCPRGNWNTGHQNVAIPMHIRVHQLPE
jgi:hypothetical protein